MLQAQQILPKKGFGGYIGTQIFQEEWNSVQKKWHINCLEMKAVFLTLKHFLSLVKDRCVLIRSDNTSVVQYIKHQGGGDKVTKSVLFDMRTLAVGHLKWNSFKGRTYSRKEKFVSRTAESSEDSSNRMDIEQVNCQSYFSFMGWGGVGVPMIDLFASSENRQTEVFCSWIPYNNALALDALTISWKNMFAYAFPPICLIPKVLKYMKEFNCRIILIAMAEETLVSTVTGVTDRSSNSVTNSRKSTESAED